MTTDRDHTPGGQVTRRTLLKWGAVLSGAAAVSGGLELSGLRSGTARAAAGDKDVTIVPSACAHNCGGRCVLKAHVKNGTITAITTDDEPDTADAPQLRACMRGRSYRTRVYHPDRLKYPMKRVGKRGEGKFERISWDEALTTIAEQLKRVKTKYGHEAMYIPYGTGNAGKLSEGNCMRRLLGLFGGYLGAYNNYSNAANTYGTNYTVGTENTGSSREDLANSRFIILWGFNPAETVFSTNTSYYLRRAKEAGAKIVVIDPRYSDTVVAFADQWIPLRPTTDNALINAIAHVLITEKLVNQAFLDKLALGYDEEHLPEGTPKGSSFKSYILGETDGTPKSPEWAEPITGIPAATIRKLAREYGAVKPAAIVMGYGPQRHAYGEQPSRGLITLQAMTGNIGVAGGSTGAMGWIGYGRSPKMGALPAINPVKFSIPVFLFTDAIVRGTEMTAADGVKGGDRLPVNIKLILNLAGNALLNQHADINKTAKTLADESKVEFIVVSEQFLTPSARFADILLPATTWFERNDIATPWAWGDYVLFQNKAIEPLHEAKSAYDWVTLLADKLGLKDKFTEGKTDEDWLRFMVEDARKAWPDFPTYEGFKQRGVYKYKYPAPYVAFKQQVEEPEKFKFPTPSGKIEIYSPALVKLNNPKEIPAIPKYIEAWEGPADPLTAKYPLQCIGWHYKRRCHSIYDNVPWMEEAARQEMWMNPIDATARGISDGDQVKVFNDRGTMVLPVKVTPRIMPGVTAVPQGAWWTPDSQGIDRRGSLNVLTSQRPTPLAKANPQHTNLVQVERQNAR
ncbi:MAG TPA: DMSO/selenate family reductase complex A subunit [Symbiobacteriaceae bacterium]|jgi:anaerobic dimethyl sulfoxide reductase subunit A